MIYPSVGSTVTLSYLSTMFGLNIKQLLVLATYAIDPLIKVVYYHNKIYWQYPAICGVLFTYGYITYKRIPFRYLASRVLSFFQRQPDLDSRTFRKTFYDTPIKKMLEQPGHSHPIAAADRSSATFFMEHFSTQLGLTPYFVQMSKNDNDKGRQGSREYYWVKDLNCPVRVVNPPTQSLMCLVDVDQYLDMHMFLATNFRPTMLYTFQPSSVARIAKNYSFTFDANDNVQYMVTCGAKYAHAVWNYSADNLSVITCYGDIPIVATSYLLDRRPTSEDHELIFMTPIGQWRGFSALLYWCTISGHTLQRLKVATNGFTRLMSLSVSGVKTSTGRVGQYLCTNTDATTDEAVATLSRTTQYKLTLPQVQSMVKGDKEKSMPLYEYHLSKQNNPTPQVCPIEEAVRQYQYQPENYCPGAKPSMVAFMTPLMHGTFAPDRTKSNEEECVQERIIKPRNKPLEMTPFLLKCMTEFVDLFVPTSHELHPTDDDEVLERQDRPTQRRLFWTSMGLLPKRLISMFLKAEAYGNIKPPRPISVINAVDKREYSKYIYALETILKQQPWYAFGKSPRDISRRVVDVLAYADFATPTDFSKFDGHGSDVMRTLESMILTRAFHPKYHPEIIELHNSQFSLEAYGMFGTWYETYWSRASGSPETSVFNTVINAFIAYLAKRISRMSPADAYNSLGIYGGDDGLSTGVTEQNYVRAAKMMGQEITIETIYRGQSGIKFLARVYSPDVWNGELTTCCDLPRQVAKFHATVRLPPNVTPQEKLLEKVRSFSLTDPYTPIIGDFCSKVIEFVGKDKIKENISTAPMRSWLSKFDMENQYFNQQSVWMEDYAADSMADFDYLGFKVWLQECKNVGDLLQAPMFIAPPEVKTNKPVVVDGIVYPLDTVVRKLDIMDMPIPEDEPLPIHTMPSKMYIRMMRRKFADWDHFEEPTDLDTDEDEIVNIRRNDEMAISMRQECQNFDEELAQLNAQLASVSPTCSVGDLLQ